MWQEGREIGVIDGVALRCKFGFETCFRHEIDVWLGQVTTLCLSLLISKMGEGVTTLQLHRNAVRIKWNECEAPSLSSGPDSEESLRSAKARASKSAKGSCSLGSCPERELPGPAPRQPGSEPLPGPPCCCTPPRSCPAPDESACRAARSSSWRRRSRALHTCRFPSVCRAGTWWRRRVRSAGRVRSGLRRAGRESGREPSLGPRGPKGGGAGAGRDGLARKRGRGDRQRLPGPTPSFKPARAPTTTTFRLRCCPALSERKPCLPSAASAIGCLTRPLEQLPLLIGYYPLSFRNFLSIGVNVCHSNHLPRPMPRGWRFLSSKGHWLTKMSVREITAQCGWMGAWVTRGERAEQQASQF